MDESSHHNQQQLVIYRRNMRHLMQQAAKFGGEDRLPTHLMNELHDARRAIAALKVSLRAAGVVVVDAPEDAPPVQPDALSAQALIAVMPLDAVPDPAPFPAFSRMPYAPNPHFVGRDDALLALAQALNGGGRVSLGQRAAATGLGGIGKTSVAAEFVHRYGQYFAGGVFWLSCADPAAVSGEVAACGGPGFLALHPSYDDLKQDEQVALVTAAWRQAIPRLLVFDNCEDPKLVETWAPPTGGCRVLITSRRQRWPSGLRVQAQRLAVLARANSIALLQNLAPRLTTVEADAIAAELGDLPLALQLAGSYLAQFERTKVATYLAELTSAAIINHPSLEGWHDEDVSLTAHDRHVGRTFLVSSQHLDPAMPTDALALKLLACAACLAPGEPIPLDLLLATADLNEELVQDQAVIQRLINLGFLSIEMNETVQLHRLIHAFVESVVQDIPVLTKVEQTVIDYTINEVRYRNTRQLLLVHMSWLMTKERLRDDIYIIKLLEKSAYLLQVEDFWMIDLAEQRLLYERMLPIYEQTVDLHPLNTAGCFLSLGVILHLMEEYTGAQHRYKQALSIYEQRPERIAVSGIAFCLLNLAEVLIAIEDYSGARPLIERALVILEQDEAPLSSRAFAFDLLGLLDSIEYNQKQVVLGPVQDCPADGSTPGPGHEVI